MFIKFIKDFLSHLSYKGIRRIFVFIIGMTIVLVGIALFVTPGPATVVIPIGLAILATEFVWARRLLNKFKSTAQNILNAVKNNKNKTP